MFVSSKNNTEVPQPKLKFGDPDEKYEREADRVADVVMRMPDSGGFMQPKKKEQTPLIQMKCKQCKEEEKLQMKPVGSTSGDRQDTVTPNLENQLNISKGQGRFLPTTVQREMSVKIADFGNVNIHTGSKAIQMNQALGARAFTHGRDIYFNRGQYDPESSGGKHLLTHELTHVVQQSPENQLIQREGGDEDCDTTYSPATTFQELVDLIRTAESQLISCGYTDVGDRIHVLRGIFYGTTWSRDYAVEGSEVRNTGFQVYTASTTPDDPRNCLHCNMFYALAGSQDIDHGGRRMDVGHLIIGMDARRSYTARNVSIPSQGGTGLAISTWLGDLGGGAAMTAYRRVNNPSRRARQNFRGTDFGGPINLEGDAAGFLVGRPGGTVSGPPELESSSNSITDWLEAYLEPGGPSAGGEWNSRCAHFLQALGGALSSSSSGPGSLSNRSDLIDNLASQIEEFGCWYLVNRLRQTNRLSLSTLREASKHMEGASRETAAIFVDALVHCHQNPGADIRARTNPAPTAKGSSVSGMCRASIRSLEAAQQAEDVWEEAEQRGSELLDRGEEVFDDARQRGEEMLEDTQRRGGELLDEAERTWEEYNPF